MVDANYPTMCLMAEWNDPKYCLAAGFNVDMYLNGTGSTNRLLYSTGSTRPTAASI